MTVTPLNPAGWPRPSGYSNGTAATGRTIFVAGQVGWHPVNGWESDDFIHQVRQCLENTVAVLAEGGAEPRHIARMTWYVTDKQEYLANLKGVGQAYRDILGKVFPAMALVQVAGLVEDRAKVEIETTAVVD